MNKLRPIFYDTETTGLSPINDRIIEVALYDPVNKKEYVSFVNPRMPIPAQATKIHQITDEMVKEAPDFSVVALEMIAFCEEGGVLVAHNNDSFDQPFLQAEFKRANVVFPEWIFIDSLKWARKYRPDLPRHTLQFLREIYGFAANNAHRALDDVIILSQVFFSMIDDLSLEQTIDLLQNNIQSTASPTSIHEMKMAFGKHQGKKLKDIPASYIQWLDTSGFFIKEENKALKLAFKELNLL